MRKFKRNFKKYICLSLCMALIITTVFVGTAATADSIEYYRSAKVWKGGDNGDTISVSDYALLDSNGNSAGGESAFTSEYIENLRNGFTTEVGAKKTVFFADKEKGYLKTNIDIVGKTTQATTEPMDILFVTDVSSSMNMFNNSFRGSLVPCLNNNHYYYISKNFSTTLGNVTVTNNTGHDLYFKMQDVCPNGITAYGDITVDMLNEYFTATYGVTLNVVGKFGSNPDYSKFWEAADALNQHYIPTTETASNENVKVGALIFEKNASNGAYEPKISNMRRSTLYSQYKNKGYCSPNPDNPDGCFDRMLATKQLIKSFTNDVLMTNTEGSENNNRVALLDFAGYVYTGTNTRAVTYDNGNVDMKYGNGAVQYPIVNFVDFTDGTNSDDRIAITNLINKTSGYAATDYGAALYAAKQVMTQTENVKSFGDGIDYSDSTTTVATLDKATTESGYIWQGLSKRSDYHHYDTNNEKYWSTPNLKKVVGTRSNAKKYVIFISDGDPMNNNVVNSAQTTAGITDEIKNKTYSSIHTNAAGEPDASVLKELKSSVDGGVYSLGYQIVDSKTKYIKQISTGDGSDSTYYNNAKTTEDFTTFLNSIKETVLKKSCKSASDSLGDNYSFICDDEHPVSVKVGADGTPVTYSSLDAAVQSGYFKLSENKKTITWNGGDVSRGVRISFYSKLDDECLFPKNASANAIDYPTNKSQTLAYTKDVDGTDEEFEGNVDYAEYKLRVRSGSAKVVLSRTPAGDIREGKDITYTLKLEESGAIVLTNVTVTATAPQYTTRKEGSNLPNNTSIVKDASLSYTVTADSKDIEIDKTVIENTAHFTISKDGNSIQNDVDLSIENINTNTVKNAVSTKGTITITAPNKKLTHDKTQAYIYKVTNSDGTEIARVMVAAGKQEVISGLGVGNYTITEITDWAWRYKDGNTNELNVSISNDNPDGHAKFSKENPKAGSLSGHSSKWSNKYGANGGVSTNG